MSPDGHLAGRARRRGGLPAARHDLVLDANGGRAGGRRGRRGERFRRAEIIDMISEQMMRKTGRVTDRGQVTIPKQIRERLGIRPGAVLEFEEAEGGRLVARKAAPRGPVDAVWGVLPLDGTSDDLIERLRGKPDPS